MASPLSRGYRSRLWHSRLLLGSFSWRKGHFSASELLFMDRNTRNWFLFCRELCADCLYVGGLFSTLRFWLLT